MSIAAHGSVGGQPKLWLRLEGGVALIVSGVLYAQAGLAWWLFAACFLAPDLSMAGYLLGPRVGAWTYNIVHSYVAPAVTAMVCVLLQWPVAPLLIWTAHIGFDRLLGYGLKYPTAFAETHLGRIGTAATLRSRDHLLRCQPCTSRRASSAT